MAQEFDLGKAPQIFVTLCAGELLVKGWDNTAVLVKEDDVKVKEGEEGLTISSNGRIQLRLPEYANLTVETVHGDAIIKNLQGSISLKTVNGDAIFVNVEQAALETVHGDLSGKHINGPVTAVTINGDAIFRNVGGISLETVHGDLAARMVNGDVDVATVAGDISLRQVTGDVSIKHGHRDANLRFLSGATSVGEINGDVRVYGELAAGKHHFQAGGDIVLRWPPSSPLQLTAQGNRILNRLPFDEVVESEDSFTGTIGTGGPVVNLEANGRIILKDLYVVREEWEHYQADDPDMEFTLDLEGLGAQINAQVNEQLSRLSVELESKFGADFTQKIAEKISRKAEQAARRAEQAAERARRRAEKHRATHYGPRPGRPPAPPRPPKPKATPEEQLKILKMVEQGVISPEEANTLLDALENK